MTRYLPKPSSDLSFSRAIARWRAESGDAPEPEVGDRPYELAQSDWSVRPYVPYAIALTLALGVGAAAASLATAPVLTDSIETVAAIDARQVGFATNLDATGQQSQQKKAAALSRDVGSMKSEIARLQRALDQSRANQAALSKTTAGQAAAASDEVKTLKSEIANLQKTLDGARGEAAAKIDGLTAKLDQSRQDAGQVAQLKERLERFEKLAALDRTPPAQKHADQRAEPETTGSVDRDARREPARAEPTPEKAADKAAKTEARPEEPRQAARDDNRQVVRNWTVREVVRGVALLEGRDGMIEVERGSRAPGIGRVRSIERRDGQWVVVTDRGVVLERDEL
ncbi:hypothetical protein [Methylopila sp. M107]|uniref:hypothetical protein n=1 Tax=Methylopila sp. M107 TaxID=1101190 RepID=UPI0003A94982|nr:hypothetical protein [Methylopila sp. M107]